MSVGKEAEWTYNVISLCCSVILIVGSILILTINKLYCTPANELLSIHLPLKLFAIGEMICYLLSYIFALLTVDIFQIGPVFHQIFYGLFVFWLIIGLICSYLFLVYRFYYTFIDSIFAMKKRTVYCHAFVVISIPTYLVFALYFYYIQLFTLLIISVIFGLGITCIAYSSLIYGFNHNLFKLVLKHRQEASSTTTTMSNCNGDTSRDRPSLTNHKSESSSLNTHQIFMIEQITKQTLLGSLHVGCILILVLICVLFYTMTRHDVDLLQPFNETESQSMDLWFLIIFSWSVTITIMTGVICVYLGFVFNADVYRCVCGQCHLICQSFVKIWLKKDSEIRGFRANGF